MDRALLNRVEKQAWFHRYPRGWPLLLFVLVAIGTLLSVMAIERAESDRRRIELDRDVTEVASGLQRRASENIAILRAAAALFATNDQVSPQQFREIASELYLGNDFHGSMGIGWARWVRPEDWSSYEAPTDEQVPGFRVHPPARPGAAAAPILYLEPRSPENQPALGFNMYSDGVRRQAMDTAARLGQPVASGRVALMRDRVRPGADGFLIYMPVFHGKGAQRAIRGFVFSPFQSQAFLASAVELGRDREVAIAVYDGSQGAEHLLAGQFRTDESDITMDRRIMVANRAWIVRVSARGATLLSTLSRVILIFGAVLALLVMLIARLITKRAAEDRAVLDWFSGQSAIRTSLTRELNHRVKNTLANVLSIVALTRRRSGSLDAFAESLTGRIRALSATHDLLSHSDWTNALISEIVRSELAPYMAEADQHVEMSGPEISLAPNDALSLGLAIHELATNAAKYGALSTTDGRILIAWRQLSPDLAEFHWREAGGPPVQAPNKRGFGRDLLEKIVAHELQSAVDLRFEPEGVECTLRVPIRRLASFALRQGKE